MPGGGLLDPPWPPRLSRWSGPVSPGIGNRVRTPSTLCRPDLNAPPRIVHARHSTPQNPSRHAWQEPVAGPCSDRSALEFCAPGVTEFRAEAPFTRAGPADGVVILEPFWERPAGTQTHSRRTGGRLGYLRCARQGLVRVPESNTKYGGKGRITGGNSAPDVRQVSVSPRGFPSKNNCRRTACARFIPLFTGQLSIRVFGLPSVDSRRLTGICGQPCRPTDGLGR